MGSWAKQVAIALYADGAVEQVYPPLHDASGITGFGVYFIIWAVIYSALR